MGLRAIIFVGMALVAIIGLGLLGVASAQMESMTIEGLKHPYVNSVFNVSVDVEGVSRASGGIFRTVMTIFEKNSGEEILAVPDYLRSGINTIQINMIPDRNTEPMKEGLTYVLQIQHVNIVSQFEFTPKAYESTQAQDQISEIDQNQEVSVVETEFRDDGIVVIHYSDGSKLFKAFLEDGISSSDDIN